MKLSENSITKLLDFKFFGRCTQDRTGGLCLAITDLASSVPKIWLQPISNLFTLLATVPSTLQSNGERNHWQMTITVIIIIHSKYFAVSVHSEAVNYPSLRPSVVTLKPNMTTNMQM